MSVCPVSPRLLECRQIRLYRLSAISIYTTYIAAYIGQNICLTNDWQRFFLFSLSVAATNYVQLKNNLPEKFTNCNCSQQGEGRVRAMGAWQLANRLNASTRSTLAIMVLLIIPIIKIVSSRDCRYALPATRYPLPDSLYPLPASPCPLCLFKRFGRVLKRASRTIMRDFYYKYAHTHTHTLTVCVCVCVRANLLIALKSALGIKNEYVN